MPPETKKTIVVIEDEQIMLNLLTARLEQLGYDVKIATNGMDGLDVIRESHPDLVLLDMMLPKLSGFGVLEKLSDEKILPGLSVIIISNSGQPVEIEHAVKLGVRDYLIKVNFDLNELLEKIKLVLGSGNVPAPISLENTVNVLIVEDDPFLIELLEKKFTKSHVHVFRAMDPETARLIIERERVDAVLLDIMLPGIDGITLLKEWKSSPKLKSIPVVITSNLGQTEEVKRGLAAGAVDYLVKSNSTPGEIVSRVMKLLNLKS